MFEGLFQPMHLLVILGLALLIFGPKKLPELGKGIGEGLRGFKSAMRGDDQAPPRPQRRMAERLSRKLREHLRDAVLAFSRKQQRQHLVLDFPGSVPNRHRNDFGANHNNRPA